MNKILLVLVLGAIVLIAFACKSQKGGDTATEGEMMDKGEVVMIFGSFGGFAGQTIRYKLHEDGRLYKGGAGETFAQVKSLDENLTTQIISNFTNLGFDTTELNDPGNMTYFIVAKKGDRQKKISWGGMNKEMPDNLDNYYRNFMKLMKRNDMESMSSDR